MLGAALVFGAFICSGYGNRFVARWETVVSDKGSGRVAIIEIAGRRLADPPSTEVFWFGRGVYRMQEMMYDEIGTRIGMHNDLLDFAIAYGIVGAALCLWAIWTVLNFHDRDAGFCRVGRFVYGLFSGDIRVLYVNFDAILLCFASENETVSLGKETFGRRGGAVRSGAGGAESQ